MIAMEKVRLGKTGLKVSRICLGTMTYGDPKWRDWVLDEAASRPFIKRALEAGINFFDTADMYSTGASEEVVGRALKDFGGKREAYVLATKVFFPVDGRHGGLSRKHIMHAIDDSLRRLGMDYVDLYQIHRFDHHTPIEETVEALHDVVKVRQGALYRRLLHACLAVRQISFHRAGDGDDQVRLHAEFLQSGLSRGGARDAASVPRCRDRRDPLEPAGARLSGAGSGRMRWTGNRPAPRATMSWTCHSAMPMSKSCGGSKRRAKKHGKNNAQIATAWLLAKGITAPIVGASKMSHLEDAIAAAEIKLTAEEVTYLEEPYKAQGGGGESLCAGNEKGRRVGALFICRDEAGYSGHQSSWFL